MVIEKLYPGVEYTASTRRIRFRRGSIEHRFHHADAGGGKLRPYVLR